MKPGKGQGVGDVLVLSYLQEKLLKRIWTEQFSTRKKSSFWMIRTLAISLREGYITGTYSLSWCTATFIGKSGLNMNLPLKIFSKSPKNFPWIGLGDDPKHKNKSQFATADHWAQGKLLKHKRQASVRFSSVAQSCLTLCEPMDCNMPGLPL